MTARIAKTLGLLVGLTLADACTLFTDLSGLSNGALDASSPAPPVDASLDVTPMEAASVDAELDADSGCAVASGLLGRWTFDEGMINGGSVLDSSGRASHGVAVGFTPPLVLVPGRIGKALQFPSSGTGANIALPTLNVSTAAGARTTVSLWFYRASGAHDDVLIDIPSSPRYDLYLTGNQLCFNTQSSECWGIEDAALFDRWVHVVALFFNGPTTQSMLYIDGVQRTLGCLTAPGFPCDVSRSVAASPITLGATDGYAFRGLLDDVRIYDRALVGQEIQQLFSSPACP